MANTTEGRIARALFDRVNTYAPALPIAAPNKDFTPPEDGRWIQVTHIPNGTERMEINSDGPHRFIGMLQISLFWPHDRGEMEPLEVAGSIINHFPCDLILIEDDVRVRIVKRPETAGVITEETGIQIPVTVEYEAYA